MDKDCIVLCKNWFDKHPKYSIEKKVICIYDLYQSYIIDEDVETELYAYVDPDDTIQNPAELWFNDDSENELANAINAMS